MRRDVFDQVIAGGRWRNHCPDLQGAGVEARLWLRRLGLDDGLSREGLGVKRIARMGYAVAVLVVLPMLGVAAPAAHSSNPNEPVNPDASVVNEQTLIQEAPRIEGRIDIPDKRASVLIQPAGRRWEAFHEVTLPWLGAIVILGMIALLALGYLL